MLRLDVDVDAPPYYTVPPTTPSSGATPDRRPDLGQGLRNPWRFSFDRATGDLYIGDVGQDAREEIDSSPAGSAGGAELRLEHHRGHALLHPSRASHVPRRRRHDASRARLQPQPGLLDHRRLRLPRLRHARPARHLLLADYCSAFIRSFARGRRRADRTSGPHRRPRRPAAASAINSITSFGEDARGELYIAIRAARSSRSSPDREHLHCHWRSRGADPAAAPLSPP